MLRRFLFPVLGGSAVLLLTACTTNQKPRFDVEDGKVLQFRRYTGRPAVDYLHRWDEKAFDRIDHELDAVLSPDQIEMLERRGQPDYVREDVKARRNELFDEWVYWDQELIVQFIGGELVYEGDLLDSDKTLVTRGYPSKAYHQEYEYGPVRETWLYEDLFEAGGYSVSFSDGRRIFQANY